MPPANPIPLRATCPPGACVCERERLDVPGADRRILQLTREEEKKLIARIEALRSYDELRRLEQRLVDLLGITLRIAPGANEVRTVRGFQIDLAEQPGLCRKTRQAVPAAVRRCLEQHPDIAFAILDANDLFAPSPFTPAPMPAPAPALGSALGSALTSALTSTPTPEPKPTP